MLTSQHFSSLCDLTKLKVSGLLRGTFLRTLSGKDSATNRQGFSKTFNPPFTGVNCAAPISYCGRGVHPEHFQNFHTHFQLHKLICHFQKSLWSILLSLPWTIFQPLEILEETLQILKTAEIFQHIHAPKQHFTWNVKH